MGTPGPEDGGLRTDEGQQMTDDSRLRRGYGGPRTTED
jgi:hypothetical protein